MEEKLSGRSQQPALLHDGGIGHIIRFHSFYELVCDQAEGCSRGGYCYNPFLAPFRCRIGTGSQQAFGIVVSTAGIRQGDMRVFSE